MQALVNSRRLLPGATLLALAGALLWSVAPAQDRPDESGENAPSGIALVMAIDDAIGVATAEYFIDSLKTAHERKAKILILELDTPGGLMEPMRDMIKEILASEVPVSVFVTPNGARAASAGTYILYASHVAAMSPATTLGAATPVNLGKVGAVKALPDGFFLRRGTQASSQDETPAGESGDPAEKREEPASNEGEAAGGEQQDEDSASEDPGADSPNSPGKTIKEIDAEAMKRKIVNDSVSYIRSLARQRSRNADWAEEAVRKGATLEATEAVEMNVADLIATDVADLLQKAHGRTVDLNGEMVELQTAGLAVERLEPGWRTRILSILTNPNVAYLLVLVGLYGLLLEGYNPGSLVPGIVGLICLLLAAYALSLLPVNYAGLALMALGVGLIIAESVTPSFGVLGLGGVVAFVVGSIILFDTGVPGFEAPLRLIGGVGLAAGLLMLGLVFFLARSRLRPVVSGKESLVGDRAVALDDFSDAGPVLVHGERWHAKSSSAVRKGQELFVQSVDGLRLEVSDSPPAPPVRQNLFTLLKKMG